MALHPGAVYGLLKELRVAASTNGPLVIEGPPALADSLRREFLRDARPGAVRGGPSDGADAFVLVVAGPLGEEQEEQLKRAHRKGVPTIAVLAGPGLDPRVPYVPATDVVSVRAGRRGRATGHVPTFVCGEVPTGVTLSHTWTHSVRRAVRSLTLTSHTCRPVASTARWTEANRSRCPYRPLPSSLTTLESPFIACCTAASRVRCA